MSIKCSLLGHRFDETSVEREREEDGSEVVITITEYETCSRCGQTRVVSENKEVTTMERLDASDDPGSEAAGGSGAASGSTAAGGSEATSGSTADDGGDGVPDDYDPAGDDAEILDADGAEADAQAQARGSASVPDAEAADESEDEPDSENVENDAVIIDDAGGGGTPSQGETDGEWPDEPASDDADEYEEWPDEARPDTGDEEADVSFDASASPTVTVPEGMYKCSECGFETEVASSSLRAGDFCPDCHTGTLLQHDDTDA